MTAQAGGPKAQGPVLITGGAGFIGTNLAENLLASGRRVIIYDNLSRAGVEENLEYLRARYGSLLGFEAADVCDMERLSPFVHEAAAVFHFAAQVAVTTSMEDPLADFKVNAAATVALLEEMRSIKDPPALVYTSTNKVYGGLESLDLGIRGFRYGPRDALLMETGIDESFPLEFKTPYGCSKGAADQYVLDYSRIFGIPAVVLRMSCIYGPHQMGTEDQGWVAHFIRRAIGRKPLNIYGDGMQVRDILYIDDLVSAMKTVMDRIDTISGQAFNIGGGPDNTVSLLELKELIEVLTGEPQDMVFEGWRKGDQRYFVSDTGKFRRATGWGPRVAPREGVERLYRWLSADALPRAAGKTRMLKQEMRN